VHDEDDEDDDDDDDEDEEDEAFLDPDPFNRDGFCGGGIMRSKLSFLI
jgi:hypothetical protein